MEILGGYLLEIGCYLADGVSPDWAQQVAASALGMHYLLGPNMEINSDGYLLRIVGFLTNGVGPVCNKL